MERIRKIVKELERQIGFINVHHLIIYPGTEDITVGKFVTVIQASCQTTTVWPEILAGNLFWWIGSFESNPPIFHPPNSCTV